MALVKRADEIERIRASGAILAAALRETSGAVRAGATLLELDAVAREAIERRGGIPAFLGYQPDGASRPFPGTLCASVNDVIVHGVPNGQRLIAGDIVKLDLGVKRDHYYADAAVTIAVGSTAPEVKKLIRAAEEALFAGILAARAGNTLGDIGYAIHAVIKKAGFNAARGLSGHGIGTRLHEEPSVLNVGEPGAGLKRRAGMVLAIEPMVSAGSGTIEQRADESYKTADGSLSAHFEHTVLVTDEGGEVLTTSANHPHL